MGQKGQSVEKIETGMGKVSAFPRTIRLMTERLSQVKEKLDWMQAQGTPWYHDAGSWHADLNS